MHARNFTTNVPKILDLKSSSEQIFFRKLSLGAPVNNLRHPTDEQLRHVDIYFLATKIICSLSTLN